MEPILVSVVIPAYNAENYVRDTIESALAQTFKQYEIIVVDDGSIDNTARVVQEFGDAIRYIYQENKGLSAARNTAIRNSKAEIIALLDADDLWEPNYLEAMIGLIDRYPEAAGVYCGFQYIDALGRIVGKPSLKVTPPEIFYETLVLEGNWLVPCSVLFRKQLAENVGLFDESLMALEDADMWIRLSAHHPFVGIPKALVRYRKHTNNMTKDPKRMIEAGFQLTVKMVGLPEGDVLTWPKRKIAAYIKHFQVAARRYLAAGDIAKSAEYLLKVYQLSPEYLCSLQIWQRLARAHIPEEYQFSSIEKYDWTKAYADVDALLEALVGMPDSPINQDGMYSKIRGVILLALADEAGKNFIFCNSFEWLLQATQRNPQIIFFSPYWRTILGNFKRMLHGLGNSLKS